MQANRNKIFLRGQVSAPPISSHINHGVEYLMIPLAVRRLSGAEDTLHVVAAQEQLANLVLEPGAPLTVRGEVRTFNNRSGVGRRLVVSVFARELSQEEKREVLSAVRRLADRLGAPESPCPGMTLEARATIPGRGWQ